MEGKVVIITGGASGLGKAAVEKFAVKERLSMPAIWTSKVWII